MCAIMCCNFVSESYYSKCFLIVEGVGCDMRPWVLRRHRTGRLPRLPQITPDYHRPGLRDYPCLAPRLCGNLCSDVPPYVAVSSSDLVMCAVASRSRAATAHHGSEDASKDDFESRKQCAHLAAPRGRVAAQRLGWGSWTKTDPGEDACGQC